MRGDRHTRASVSESPHRGRVAAPVGIDATHVKARQEGRIVSVVGLSQWAERRRPARGAGHGGRASEPEAFWKEFLRGLPHRGLREVKRVISDHHSGIKAAVSKRLTACWQCCRVYFMRNALSYADRQGKRVIAAFIATAIAQDTAATAREQVAPCGRSAASHGAQARRADGHGRRKRTCLHELPARASHHAAQHQPNRAAES